MPLRSSRPSTPRRGVTLVEMLVAVALLVLMMTVIVTIFKAATGAVTGLRVYQELDGSLRQLDSIIRQDLDGVTARMTPPLNPKDNLGYFEYIENQFADPQGEDSDDCLRFTAKAPEGQFFTGRCWVGSPTIVSGKATIPRPLQPVVVTSQYAEIIYFLRNGNLYRRVLLIAPERQSTINNGSGVTFNPDMLGNLSVSWQGMNDLSARPTPLGSAAALTGPIILNTLGDLTNRENRYASPRFGNDFVVNSSGAAGGDGLADDEDADAGGNIVGDGIHDYYPSLYPNLFLSTNPGLIFEASTLKTRAASYETMAFPYIFPGAYSQPDAYTLSYKGSGWIHSTDPSTTFTNALAQLVNINHNPLELGDNISFPGSGETYWGFPTWRETMSVNWTDPAVPVTAGGSQANFLHPSYLQTPPTAASSTPPFTILGTDFLALPPMIPPFRTARQVNTEVKKGAEGTGSIQLSQDNVPSSPTSARWNYTWEDDLVMTGVRSFDVKAYDDAYAGYADLGWGDDLRLYQPYISKTYTPPNNTLSYLSETPATITWPPTGVLTFNTVAQTFAHEGRMPPLRLDGRYDANFVHPFYDGSGNLIYGGNVGDDNHDVIRLRRVWDTWSTEYTRAPATGFDPTSKLPVGTPFGPPVYPSYPPPYPAPLRGIQIQIRVVDPRNEKVKSLTIHQDFSDKL